MARQGAAHKAKDILAGQGGQVVMINHVRRHHYKGLGQLDLMPDFEVRIHEQGYESIRRHMPQIVSLANATQWADRFHMTADVFFKEINDTSGPAKLVSILVHSLLWMHGDLCVMS